MVYLVCQMSLTVLRNRKKYLRYPLPLISLKEEQKLFKEFEKDDLDHFLESLKGTVPHFTNPKIFKKRKCF